MTGVRARTDVADHLRAGGEPGHPGAALDHDSREIASGPAWKDLVAPFGFPAVADERLDVVDARGDDFDQHFPGPSGRELPFADLQYVDISGCVVLDDSRDTGLLHGDPPC